MSYTQPHRRWVVIDAAGQRRTVYIALGATREEMHARYADARHIEPVVTVAAPSTHAFAKGKHRASEG